MTRSEPGRSDPARTKPNRIDRTSDPIRTDSNQTGPDQIEPDRIDWSEPNRIEPIWTDCSGPKTESLRTANRSEQIRSDPYRSESNLTLTVARACAQGCMQQTPRVWPLVCLFVRSFVLLLLLLLLLFLHTPEHAHPGPPTAELIIVIIIRENTYKSKAY